MLIHRSLARAVPSVVLILFLSTCGGGGGGGNSPPPPLPSATTTDANPVTNDNAVLNGDVTPNGLATTAWFEHGQDNTLSVFTKTVDQTIGSGNTPVPIAQPISGLSPGYTYYYRVAARNSAGTSKGTIESFAAALLPPTVTTLVAGPVTNDNAVLNGDVDPNGLATTAWFEFGQDSTLQTYTKTDNQSIASGNTPVPITQPISGLIPGNTYYYRSTASNSAGTSRGTIENFKATQIPSVATNPAAPVASTTATLNGSVNPNGLQTNYWFLWGNDPNLTNPALTHETTHQVIAAGTFTTQSVSAPLSGLSISTTYYFRVVASNTAGESQGIIRNFQTTVSPTVTTIEPATSITTTGAVLHGDVNPNGYATDAWFEYGTDPGLSSWTTTASQPMGASAATLPFSQSVSGLTPWTTYYYRAAAGNSGGTQKGEIKSFPTGEYYVAIGDSITNGSQDDIFTDGIGYEPILGNLLSGSKGFPVTIATEGVPGATSEDGAALIFTTLSKHPSGKYFLILYGTNDADFTNGPVSKATYKSNMQAIITAIRNAGRIPYLSKVPYTTNPSFSNTSIQDYNLAIDELRASNGISVVAPNFFTWFQSHPSQLADGLHPNGTGYQSMANLWFNVLP